jgi:hypothetical protein
MRNLNVHNSHVNKDTIVIFSHLKAQMFNMSIASSNALLTTKTDWQTFCIVANRTAVHVISILRLRSHDYAVLQTPWRLCVGL